MVMQESENLPPKYLSKLQDAMRKGKRFMRPFCDLRNQFVAQYTGKNYPGGTSGRKPINKLNQEITIISRLLTARNPSVLVRAKRSNLAAQSEAFRIVLQHVLQEIQFQENLRLTINDALMGFGIAKVALETNPQGIVSPFYARISPDHFIIDPAAQSRWSYQFIADRNPLDLEDARESGLYQNLDSAVPNKASSIGETKVEDMSRKESQTSERLRDEIMVWEVYIPRERIVVTLSDPDFAFMRSVPWEGPEEGPYQFLGFSDVPDNVIPISPTSRSYDLDLLINKLMVKLGRQAERQKTVLGFQGGTEGDASRIIQASDGDAIRMDNPAGAKEFKYGGPESVNQTFLIWCLQQFNSQAGNLEILGGLNPQSPTAAQDQMLQQQAGVQIDDMRDRVIKHVKEAVKKIGWMIWTDPITQYVIEDEITAMGQFNYVFSPMDRKGDFLDYAFDIEPYSMLPMSPQAEYRKIQEMLQTVIMPMAGIWQQQGANIDAQALLDLLARYNDTPDLKNIIKFAPPPQMMPGMPGQGQAPAEAPPKPPVTTRRYERINRSGTTPRGLDAQLMQGLMASAKQGK